MENILEILETKGPLTGKELLQETSLDSFALWVACNRIKEIFIETVGKRYLRLDRQIEGYARLSPSIMREFYGYTVIGSRNQSEAVRQKARALQNEIREISKKKFALAQKTISQLVETHEDVEIIKKNACFMLAGDVVYDMAHAEPRPETSTGELVKGSDLDIVVVLEGVSEKVQRRLEEAIYAQKYKLLVNPAIREEVDYIIKDLSRVREQLKFIDFKSMVAVKILNEAIFLYGSIELYNKIKIMLKQASIPKKIRSLEKEAQRNRQNAETYLLKAQYPLSNEEAMKFFYTTEEKEEIF